MAFIQIGIICKFCGQIEIFRGGEGVCWLRLSRKPHVPAEIYCAPAEPIFCKEVRPFSLGSKLSNARWRS